MQNLIRRIRLATAMNQTDFGRAIGRSMQSVQTYERGATPPFDVIERLRSLATEAGRPDLAVALSSDETTFSSASLVHGLTGRRRHAHELLDKIFDSEDADALAAVEPDLELFAKCVEINTATKKR